MSTTQRIYETHGTATVEIAVDYGTTPPTITRYDIVGDVYESASELAAADEYHAAARWVGCGYDARNGGMTEAHRRDLRCAEDIAFAAASKQWRVFRRRLSEATDIVACYPCEGRGWVTTEHGDRVECEWCDGYGSSIFNPWMPCPTCGHASTFHEADGRCPTE